MKLPVLIAIKMLLYPVFCHDAVILLHELSDCRPDILMADRTFGFDLELTEAHLALLHLCVDDLGNAGVPTAAGSILDIVNASFHG